MIISSVQMRGNLIQLCPRVKDLKSPLPSKNEQGRFIVGSEIIVGWLGTLANTEYGILKLAPDSPAQSVLARILNQSISQI